MGGNVLGQRQMLKVRSGCAAGKVMRFVIFLCLIPTAVVIVMSPVWVTGLAVYLLIGRADLKNEGIALVSGMVGFALAWPYGMFVRPVLASIGLFPG